MIPLILAQTHSVFEYINAASVVSTFVLAVVVLFRMGTGQDSERQIEPTALAAIQEAQKEQTAMLGKLDREMGEVKTNTSTTSAMLAALQAKQSSDIAGAHRRIDGLSERVSTVEGRLK